MAGLAWRSTRVLGVGLAAVALTVLMANPVQAQTDQPTVTQQTSGTDAVLQAVSPVSDEVVWISGHRSTLIRTRNSGRTWETIPTPGGDSLQFRDVHGFSETGVTLLTSGDGPMSRIYHSPDAGGSWTLQYLMTEPDGFLDCLDFFDDRRGFAYGDAIDGAPFILRTADGGASWARVSGDRLPPAMEGEGGFAASGTCARAGENGAGWIGTGAGGSARILTTEDHGEHWTSTDVPMARGPMAGIFSIAMADGTPYMILGGDLGTEEVVSSNSARIEDGEWIATEAAPVPGAVYGSSGTRYGGDTWVVAVSPAASAASADGGGTWIPLADVFAWAVEFAPAGGTAWAAGTQGRVWRINLPR